MHLNTTMTLTYLTIEMFTYDFAHFYLDSNVIEYISVIMAICGHTQSTCFLIHLTL